MLPDEDYALAIVSSSDEEAEDEEEIKATWGHEDLAQVHALLNF